MGIASEMIATVSLRGLGRAACRPAGRGDRRLRAVIRTHGPGFTQINVDVSYAIWSAAGTAAIAVLGVIFFQAHLNLVAISGLVPIVLGVVLVTASGSTTHG